MRKIRLFAAAASLVMLAFSVNAQEWTSVRLSYNAPFYSEKTTGDPEDAFLWGFSKMGMSAGVTHGFSVSSTMPIYVEPGVMLKWDHLWNDSYDAGNEKFKIDIVSVEVPVNAVYKFTINDFVSIKPQVGLYAVYHFSGKGKDTWDNGTAPAETTKGDLFDKKDTGDLDGGAFKRFNMGWRIGCGVDLSKFYLGLSFGCDFTKIQKNIRRSEFTSTVGYNF